MCRSFSRQRKPRCRRIFLIHSQHSIIANGFIDALEHKFCGNCNRIPLTATGFLTMCLNFDSGLDVKDLLQSNFDAEKILATIREAIYRKPREHDLGGTTTFQMYQVGS